MKCRCGKQHRSHRTQAACIWPRAEWIVGVGPYALLAHCDVLTTVLVDGVNPTTTLLARRLVGPHPLDNEPLREVDEHGSIPPDPFESVPVSPNVHFRPELTAASASVTF